MFVTFIDLSLEAVINTLCVSRNAILTISALCLSKESIFFMIRIRIFNWEIQKGNALVESMKITVFPKLK